MNIKYYERLKLIAERIKKNNFNTSEILDHQLIKDEKIHTIDRVINLFSYLLNDQILPNASGIFMQKLYPLTKEFILIYPQMIIKTYLNLLTIQGMRIL